GGRPQSGGELCESLGDHVAALQAFAAIVTAPVDVRPATYVRRLPQKLHCSRLTSRESPGTSKRRPMTELLLDAQELVVLRESFRLGERADLDLARGGGDGEVCEEGILRLS